LFGADPAKREKADKMMRSIRLKAGAEENAVSAKPRNRDEAPGLAGTMSDKKSRLPR